jgi:Fur family ferric uptake transcriptional regulator
MPSSRNPSRTPDAERDPVEELTRRGLRATRQRLAVLRMLRQRPGHPTALAIHRRLLRQHPTLSQKTVYEILDALVDAGIAARVAHGGGPARYELRRERHYHAECRVCGRLEDVPASADGPIRGHAIVPDGFRIEEIHGTIEGRCERCAARERGKAASRGPAPG